MSLSRFSSGDRWASTPSLRFPSTCYSSRHRRHRPPTHHEVARGCLLRTRSPLWRFFPQSPSTRSPPAWCQRRKASVRRSTTASLHEALRAGLAFQACSTPRCSVLQQSTSSAACGASSVPGHDRRIRRLQRASARRLAAQTPPSESDDEKTRRKLALREHCCFSSRVWLASCGMVHWLGRAHWPR